jgi:hypothetical protein
MTVYSPPAHRMTSAELRAALTDCSATYRRADCTPYAHCRLHRALPRVSPWVQRAIAGTLPAPTLAPTQAEIDADLHERYRFAFRVLA